MINLDNVSKIFKSDLLNQPFTALKNVTFEIPEGSMIGFLGANGAGKTTSLKIIMDFIKPSSGSVNFSPKLGRSRNEILKNIGFLPERPYFYPSLTGRDFVHFMGKLSGMSRSEVNDSLSTLSPRFKIDHALDRELKTYSKGMLQRIGFMATIIHRPMLIVLDEPLSGLDPIGRKEIKDIIIDLHKEGKTVFFSTHIVPDVEEVCDRVVFLKEGGLIYDGPVQQLLHQKMQNDIIVVFRNPDNYEIKTPAEKIQNLPDMLTKVRIKEINQESLLHEILQNKYSLISFDYVKPSLEDIFYQLRN